MTTVNVRSHNGVQIPAPGTFTLDPSHTTIGFVARHLMVTKVRGRFSDFTGSITFAEEPLASSAEVTIQVASVTTGDDRRDEHLKSADFFDVDNHPTMTFRSTEVKTDGGGRYVLTGDLTIKGVTRSVDLAVEPEGVGPDPWGGERAGFTASAEVDREAWGLTWNVALDAGGVLVSKNVKLEIDVQAVRQA